MDWNHINTLLSVIHQAAAAGPKFAAITSAATDELFAHFNSGGEVQPEEPTEEEEAETDE